MNGKIINNNYKTIYPYTFVTDKQREAMRKAGVPFEYLTVYDITYKGILKLLN